MPRLIRGNESKETYRVGDDQDVSLGSSLSGGLGKVTDDRGVGVEEIITGHTGLAGNTGRDEDDLRALKAVLQTLGGGVVASDSAVGVDVAQISGNTWAGIRQNPLGGAKLSTNTKKKTYRVHHGYRRGQARRHAG